MLPYAQNPDRNATRPGGACYKHGLNTSRATQPVHRNGGFVTDET